MSFRRSTTRILTQSPAATFTRRAAPLITHARPFHLTRTFKMPEALKAEEVNAKNDPSVTKQYDNETSTTEQINEFFSLADGLKCCLLTTQRANIGPVSRSMAVAKRIGPDFLFLANINSQKFKDLDADKTVQITFQDSSSQNWASISGKATTASNSDPRIKDLVNPFASAWFGDLGDGVHTGKAEDPRMSLIEVKAEYITYWLTRSSKLGYLKEVAEASLTGKVATTGVTRELKGSQIEEARKMDRK